MQKQQIALTQVYTMTKNKVNITFFSQTKIKNEIISLKK